MLVISHLGEKKNPLILSLSIKTAAKRIGCRFFFSSVSCIILKLRLERPHSMKLINWCVILLTSLSTCILLSTTILFTVSSHAQVLEEIIVTSQKRAESLQDVSVSVTALSGEKLADGAIARLEEVTAFVPNFTMSETGIGTNIYIRGIGSGINQGFEQSVGMYFDGIYYGRAQLARSPIFDLERLEVLKGPQVTLFGNNSIGGAVSINSAKPTDYFQGSVKLLYSPEHGEDELNFVLSGPITDNLNSRLAIRKYDMDGYMLSLIHI